MKIFLIIVVILIVIVYNFFAYGRDLSIYPKSGVRRVSDDEYYPGSPLYINIIFSLTHLMLTNHMYKTHK